MLSIQPKKFAAGFIALLTIAASCFIVSCQKELSPDGGFTVTETPPDLSTKISSSVSGFVTDETDAAVNGAAVQFGASSTTTDKYGYFEFSDVQVVKNAAVVTVIKAGYFKGIKTYIAAENKGAFFRIKILPKTNQGSFDAATGGTVTLTNGLSVTFPAAAVAVVSSGVAYTGQVNIAAQWINPTAADLDRTMPGDLRGLDSLGFIRSLTTYGMAAVELTSASGELLKVAPGQKATLSFPIPSALSSAAPATLPLWSFDENNGLWKQEGFAVKSGNNYVGQVSHFSFWNCDVPANYVQFSCTVKDAAGNAVPGAFVKISVQGNPQNARWGFTDSSGYTGGAVPNNSQLLLEVYNSHTCGTAVYSQTFSTTNQDVHFDNITIAAANIATVTGNVINCSAAPVTNGYIIMIKDGYAYRYQLSSTGAFSFTTTLCNSSSTAELIAEDVDALQSGTSVSSTLVPGNNDAGTLSACGISIEQFINYNIDGTGYSFVYPGDSIAHYVNPQTTPPLSYIIGGSNLGTADNVNFSFTQNGIVAGGTQMLTSFYSMQLTDSVSLAGSPVVNITEYGNVGEFLAGNFTCTMVSPPPASVTHNITCNFRTRRRQ